MGNHLLRILLNKPLIGSQDGTETFHINEQENFIKTTQQKMSEPLFNTNKKNMINQMEWFQI